MKKGLEQRRGNIKRRGVGKGHGHVGGGHMVQPAGGGRTELTLLRKISSIILQVDGSLIKICDGTRVQVKVRV